MHFEPSLELKPRYGTDRDRDNLRSKLKSLGFEVDVYEDQDCTKSAVESILQKTSKKDHSDADCIFVAVLTHGGVDTLWAYDQQYRPNMLWSHFTADKCPSLARKPKLFFIQVIRLRLKTFLTCGAGLPWQTDRPGGQSGGHGQRPDGGGRRCHVQDPHPSRLSDCLQYSARLLKPKRHGKGQLVHTGLLSRHSGGHSGGAPSGPPVHDD